MKLKTVLVFGLAFGLICGSIISTIAFKVGTDGTGQTWFGPSFGTTITNSKGYEGQATVANIQIAIDSGGNNSVIYIPGGNYTITETIWVNYTGITIQGVAPTEAGQRPTAYGATRFYYTVDLPNGVMNVTGAGGYQGAGVTINNIQFYNSDALLTNTKALCVNGKIFYNGTYPGVHGVTISGCSFDNIANTAIYMNYSYNSEITDCIFSNCGGDVGSHPTIFLDKEVNSLVIHRCTFEADEYVSIWSNSYNVPNLHISENYFEAVSGVDNQPDNAFLNGTFQQAYINNNYCYGNDICDGFYTGGSDNFVTSNRFNDVKTGIHTGAYTIISNNEIIKPYLCGINIGGDNVVTGNYIDCDNIITVSSAILINGNRANIMGNTIRDSIYGIVLGAWGGSPTGHRINYTITGNNVFGVTKTNITESYGTCAIAGLGTSIVVNHNLSATPKIVICTPMRTMAGTASYWYVDTFTATQFTVHTNAAIGATAVEFSWYARV